MRLQILLFQLSIDKFIEITLHNHAILVNVHSLKQTRGLLRGCVGIVRDTKFNEIVLQYELRACYLGKKCAFIIFIHIIDFFSHTFKTIEELLLPYQNT